MLPFLKPKQIGSVIIHRYDKGKQEPLHEEGEPDPGLMIAAEDLLRAVSAKDAQGVVMALQSAFEIMDSEPQIEGEPMERVK